MSSPTPPADASGDTIKISVIQDPADFLPFFEVAARCFGTQNQDELWKAISPGWDTPAGREANAARLAQRFRTTTINRDEDPNTVFLKATAAPGDRIVGISIWAQLSFAEGWGDEPSLELKDVNDMYLDDATRRQFASQVYGSSMRTRVGVVQAKKEDGGSAPPAVFVLDLCAVDPEFQRRGIASRLVRWGLDEARRRGGLEAATEASVMGRGCYGKLGFRPVKEIEYEIEDGVKEAVLQGRQLPSNLFMRTGA